jgi:hypothetical protein
MAAKTYYEDRFISWFEYLDEETKDSHLTLQSS